jgi:two-component system NtrC family sensor kinase
VYPYCSRWTGLKRSVLTARSWVLLISAALVVSAGVLNFTQRSKHKSPPTDGITWSQRSNGVYALKVDPGSIGQRAGVLPGDRLISIGEEGFKPDEIALARDVQIYLSEAGVGGHLVYLIERPTMPEDTRFYYADLYNLDSIPKWTNYDVYLVLIGLVYLFIGIFVLFKQGGRAPFVLHFATLCLVAFVIHSYKPVGTYKDLDLAVAFLKNSAFILFAPLFVHFCAIYPVRKQLAPEHRWIGNLVYAPAMALLVLAVLIFFRSFLPFLPASVDFTEDFIGFFYKASFVHFWLGLVGGTVLLVRRFITTDVAVVRQQLKWVVWGLALAVAPFSIFYAVRFVFDLHTPDWWTGAAVLPLILIPLTFGNSVVRYRLMDVDIVVRRVAVYALTTLAIAMMIGTVAYVVGRYAIGVDALPGEITLPVVIAVLAMTAIVMLAAPIKTFLQERTDRIFYGERYDMRNSLLDFGRTLSATTSMDPLLKALISRLQQVLNVERLAIFVEDPHVSAGYSVARAAGLSNAMIVPPDFREMIRARSAETGIVRADDLDLVPDASNFVRRALHYYVPCVSRGRMVAVIGLGRGKDGSLLSSEDMDILRTISGYVAVAIENSLLYQEQQEHASELQMLKEFNESIVESINVGLLAVDIEGTVTRCNSALEEMLGIERDKVVGREVEELFAEDFAETLAQSLGPARWQISEVRNLYKIHTATRNGRTLVLNIAFAPLQAMPVEPRTGTLVVLEDVTARTRLEEQLQQREKLSSIGLLAAGVAHEVNTPLTGVSSYTQMLLGMLPDTDPKHALLQKVRRQADRASNIVNNLLNFSRAGNSAEFGDLDVHRVIDDTLQLLEPQLRQSQIEVKRDFDKDIPKTFGSAGKLQQVFTNLILNARDASPDGGEIRLVTSLTAGDSIQIEVSDNGIGIEPENVAKIYDPFFTTKGVGRGTGLGLAVTYGIVQEHSGHISVDSHPGRGTTFKITLPVAHSHLQLQAAGD